MPNEFRRPSAALVLPDRAIAVVQFQPPKLLLFEKDGTPAGSRITGLDGERIQPQIEVVDRDRAIRWLGVDERDYRWVLPGRGTGGEAPGVIGTFDVFGPGGRYPQAVTLRGEGDLDEDRFVLERGLLFVLKQYAAAHRLMPGSLPEECAGAAEPMAAICYRVVWDPARFESCLGQQKPATFPPLDADRQDSPEDYPRYTAP